MELGEIESVEGKTPIDMPDGSTVTAGFKIHKDGYMRFDFTHQYTAEVLAGLLLSTHGRKLLSVSLNHVPAKPEKFHRNTFDTDSNLQSVFSNAGWSDETIRRTIQVIKDAGFEIWEKERSI